MTLSSMIPSYYRTQAVLPLAQVTSNRMALDVPPGVCPGHPLDVHSPALVLVVSLRPAPRQRHHQAGPILMMVHLLKGQ